MTPCAAKKRDGTPCARPAMRNQRRCDLHGGKSPQALAGADRRLKEQQAKATIAHLITTMEGEVDPDPLVNLVRMVTMSAVAERALATALEAEGEILTHISYGVQGTRLEPHPLLKLWNEERDRLAKISKLALDAGVAQRQLSIAEGQARLMVDVVFAVLDDLGLQGQERDKARQAAAHRMRVMSGTATPSLT